MAAPLMISGNVRDMDPTVLQTYLDPDVIAIDQDPLGRQVWLRRRAPRAAALCSVAVLRVPAAGHSHGRRQPRAVRRRRRGARGHV